MAKVKKAGCYTASERSIGRASDIAKPFSSKNKTVSRKVGIKSVMGSNAQTTTMYHRNNGIGNGIMARVYGMIHEEQKDAVFCLLAELMLLHGLRVSEVLRIEPKDISSLGKVKIWASKKSKSKIVNSENFTHVLLKIKESGYLISEHYNRHFMYRKFKQYGVYGVYGSNKKRSVTHALRHEVGLDMMSINSDIEDVQCALGHKVRSNSYIYARKRKE